MSAEQHKKLVEKLILRTIDRNLKWEPTLEDDTFQVSFIKNSVRVAQVYNSFTDGTDLRIDLINSEGQIVDSFTDVDLNFGAPAGEAIWFTKMKILHDSARRGALGSDEVLDDIMRELD